MTVLVQLKPAFTSFIKHLFTRGTSAFLIILGRRETGKTDFALLIAEILYNAGIIKNVATNIKIHNSPFPITHIDNLDDLRLWSRDTRGRKLFLFDEYGKVMRRRTPMSRLNIKLIDDLQVLRKFKLSTVAITVNEKYIDNAVLGTDILDGYFFKPNYKNPKLALYFDHLENYTQTLTGIPRTSIAFDTWDVAAFKEHGLVTKPKFKDEELNILWDWSHGMTVKNLGIHCQEINRLTRKFIKETLERTTSHITNTE